VATSESPAALAPPQELVPIAEVPSADDAGPNAHWPDVAAEAEFLAGARERGEPVVAAKPKPDDNDETSSPSLPALDDLVQRIPAEVRDVLEDLFRARFVTVKRVPKKALKS
jgi:hypothetical protein